MRMSRPRWPAHLASPAYEMQSTDPQARRQACLGCIEAREGRSSCEEDKAAAGRASRTQSPAGRRTKELCRGDERSSSIRAAQVA